MKAVDKDVQGIFAEMELFLLDIAGDGKLSEEQRLRRDNLAEKMLRFRQQQGVLKMSESTSSFTCSSCLSRTYVEQVSNVAWPKVKCRPRSHSYPLIKRLNPLPRLIEEDETSPVEVEKPFSVPTYVPQVQTLNWTDNKLSDDWLYRINTLRSTLTSLESSEAKSPPRSTKSSPAKSTTGENRDGPEASPTATRRKSSLERLRKAVKEGLSPDHHCAQSDEPISKTDQGRKPDSTYISLISGVTHDSNQALESEGKASKQRRHSDPKRLKNCKNWRCIQMNMFAPRNIFCSSQRNAHCQMANSSEYIQQIASLG